MRGDMSLLAGMKETGDISGREAAAASAEIEERLVFDSKDSGVAAANDLPAPEGPVLKIGRGEKKLNDPEDAR